MSRASQTLVRLAGAVVLAFLYVPLIAIVVFSFNSARHGNAWQSFTTKWYVALFRNETALDAAGITLLVAVASTLLATLLGTLAALALAQRRFPGAGFCEWIMLVPLVIPDIVLGVALLTFFHLVHQLVSIVQPGVVTLTMAHVTFQIPFVTMVIRARLAGLDPALNEAARDLGASGWQVFWRIQFPLIRPGILAGALLAFTLSVDDFVVSFFTTGAGATTLPILIYSSVKRGITPEINALASLMISLSVVAAVVVARSGRSKFNVT